MDSDCNLFSTPVKRFMQLDICYLRKYVSITDWSILFVGCIFAGLTGAGLPHLVDVVGWILNIYIYDDPSSREFHSTVSPLLIYFVSMALMLAIIAFFQYLCFRGVALKVSRRIRRACFRKAVYQQLEFFGTDMPAKINATFENDVKQLTVALGDSLPNIVTTLSQLAVALITAYTLVWRLSIAMTVFGIVIFFYILLMNHLIQRQGEKEKKVEADFDEAVEAKDGFFKHLSKLKRIGIVKGIMNGTLTGSIQFFNFFGMAISAFYGNWLYDRGLMKLPGYMFVVCSTIVPAFVRLATLPAQIKSMKALCNVGTSLKAIDSSMENVAFDPKVDLEAKRREFLIAYCKAEVGPPKERLHHHKSPCMYRVRRNALSLWWLYIPGTIFCGMVAVSAAAVTKMNGNMFTFFQHDYESYFPLGVRHAWQYIVVGSSILLSGFLMGIVFGYSSERIAQLLRQDLHDVTANGFLEKPGLVILLKKYSGQLRSAFDQRFAIFIIGLVSVFCGILSNIHKNLIYSFLASVAYSIQTVAQFFVYRFSDIHLQHAKKATLKRGHKLVEKMEAIPVEEIENRQHEMSKEHNRFLSFQFHKDMSNVVAQAVKFMFTVAVPQVTQSFAYSIGTYLIFDNHVEPLTVYKIMGTIHASVAAVTAAATFPNEVYSSRLAAQHIDDVIPLASFGMEEGSSRKSSTSSTDSDD